VTLGQQQQGHGLVEAIDLTVTARAVAVVSMSAQVHGASSTVSGDRQFI